MFFIIKHEAFPNLNLTGTISEHGLIYFLAEDVARLMKTEHPKRWARWYTDKTIGDIVRPELNLRRSLTKLRILSLENTVAMLKFSKRRGVRRFASQLKNYGPWTKCLRYPPDEFLDIDSAKAPVVTVTLKREVDEEGFEDSMEGIRVWDVLSNFLRDMQAKALEFYANLEQKNLAIESYKNSIEMHLFERKLGDFGLSRPPRFLQIHFGKENRRYMLF